MYRHGYTYSLHEAEAKRLGFLLDLKKAPTEETKHQAQMRIEEVDKEITWFTERIEAGKDPGPQNY